RRRCAARPARVARSAPAGRTLAGAGRAVLEAARGRVRFRGRAGVRPGRRSALAVLAQAAGSAGVNASPRIRRRDPAPAGDWPDAFPPLLRRLHAARGSANAQQAMPRLADLPPPDAMPGIDAGVALLAGAIARQRRIVVVADFDCD